MARTERESEKRKKSGRFVVAAKTSKERAEWRRFQQRNLSILGPAEKERMASVPQSEHLESRLNTA